MNWFQIVFLREDSQVIRLKMKRAKCCELISNCIFTWGFTSMMVKETTAFWLWIDFKLYFYVRIHKTRFRSHWRSYVVNWFQIVFLREDSQESLEIKNDNVSCELISNCIFTWGFTSQQFFYGLFVLLWIDFKLYFYVRIHK